MVTSSVDLKTQVTHSDWFRGLARYEQPDLHKAIWQCGDTIVPYVCLWALMVYMVRHGVSFWLTLPLLLVAAGLLVRIFIFFHDCGHSSFFASRHANRIMGYVFGVLTFTPFEEWRLSHAGHHASVGDLDRRGGGGDIWTLTVEDYRSAPKRNQIAYWFYRNPLFLFVLGPPIVFVIAQRFPKNGATPQERASVVITNLALLALVSLASVTLGLRTYLIIQMPILSLAASLGMWLFYVQHQFEGVYWARHSEWDPIRAALVGSSYYRLPKVLQWFSGNIGLHHIHHLRPRIPNYNLQRCYDEVPALQAAEPLTIRKSLRSPRLNLWDEQTQKLVSFHSLKKRP